MKKKILLIVIASFMLMGVVSAASVWGTYKGSNIIRLTFDGDPIKVSDAPAISMDGRTMIPIYLLKQANINYTWDQKNQTVNIIKPYVPPVQQIDYAAIREAAVSWVKYYSGVSDGYKRLEDLGESIALRTSLYLSSFDLILDNYDAESNFTSALAVYEESLVNFQNLESFITSTSEWMEENNDKSNMLEIYNKFGDAIQQHKNVLDSMKGYKNTRIQKYSDDFYYYMELSRRGQSDNIDKALAGYNKYISLITNYK